MRQPGNPQPVVLQQPTRPLIVTTPPSNTNLIVSTREKPAFLSYVSSDELLKGYHNQPSILVKGEMGRQLYLASDKGLTPLN